MSAGACHDLHEFDRRRHGTSKALGTRIHIEPRAQLGFLRCNSGGAVVRVAPARANATDGMLRCVCKCDPVRAERQSLDEVGRRSQSPVMMSGTSCRPSRSRWRRARGSAAIVGTEMCSRNINGAAPVAPPLLSSIRPSAPASHGFPGEPSDSDPNSVGAAGRLVGTTASHRGRTRGLAITATSPMHPIA